MDYRKVFEKVLMHLKEKGFEFFEPSKGEIKSLANEMIDSNEVDSLIFSHKFAKCFWSEDLIQTGKIKALGGFDKKFIQIFGYEFLPAWQYHLQEMVLEKEPLKYLAEFVDE
jgi:hypothetical protein